MLRHGIELKPPSECARWGAISAGDDVDGPGVN